jgi:hypothetical protein
MNVMNPEDAVPKSRVVLSIYCKGLQNKDSLSKPDPFCVVQEKAPNGLWRDVGRTEVACCQRTQLPLLSSSPVLFFLFFRGTKNLIQFELRVRRRATGGAGGADSKAGEEVKREGNQEEERREQATMNVMNPEDGVPKSRVVLSIYCKGLQNKDSLSKPDPFCVVQEKAPNGLWRDVGRTEVTCCQRTQLPLLSSSPVLFFLFFRGT